jgi:hypothetical protein
MPAEDYPTRPCPRCNADLEPAGEVEIEGRGSYPTYVCENEACAGSFEMEGEHFECLYPFAVIDGQVVELPMV